jgi:hypothetical protein
MAILERLRDPYGSAILGWLAPHVLYARFERRISADLGVRFARRFAALIGDKVGVHYFGDSNDVESYDLMALTAVMDAMLAKRAQFELIVARPWKGALGSGALALVDQFGCLEYVQSAAEFDARLRSVAPSVDLHQYTSLVDTGRYALGRDADSDTPAPASARTGPAAVAYSYVFDLRDFERGTFTATRFAHLSTRPSGAWVCVARSDEQALALARRAALTEWALPVSRLPEQFTVRFVDAPG